MSSLLRLHQEQLTSKSVLAVFTFRSYTWDKFASRIRENIDIKDDCIFSLLDDDAFSDDERKNILARHFQVNNIVCCDDVDKENVASPDILNKTKQGQMHTETFLEIINLSKQIPNAVGFPIVCATFCFNRRLLAKGKEYLLNPIEILGKDVTALMKSKQEEDRQKFCTLVYAALNGGHVKVGEERMTLYTDICKALKLKNGATQVLDIDDHYLLETGNNTFEFQHEILLRIVLFTFAEQYPEIFVKNCNPNVLLRYIRTKSCTVDENEDVLTVRKEENYKLLAQRFLDILDDPDIEDIRSHVCMSEKKFSDIFAKRYSKEFEGTGKKKNPAMVKVRSSVRNSISRITWGQQTKL
ncbi:hypothetical protein FSP39_000978 [Pinctada imbricata]|uniref:Uncharacterized protein n=1 Tax=Pinctada imbricata TaxID=66713 RepID=A0AA88YK22_PINIB|nr:hypothetical protein FSP39_000978 [Pinctada imbricata]